MVYHMKVKVDNGARIFTKDCWVKAENSTSAEKMIRDRFSGYDTSCDIDIISQWNDFSDGVYTEVKGE